MSTQLNYISPLEKLVPGEQLWNHPGRKVRKRVLWFADWFWSYTETKTASHKLSSIYEFHIRLRADKCPDKLLFYASTIYPLFLLITCCWYNLLGENTHSANNCLPLLTQAGSAKIPPICYPGYLSPSSINLYFSLTYYWFL